EPSQHQRRRNNRHSARYVEDNRHTLPLWQEGVKVHGPAFVFRLALILSADFYAGHTPEVIARVLALAGDQQIVLFVHHVLTPILAHFEIGSKLNRVSGAGLLAEAAEDAARKINAEEFRIAPAGLVFRGLERDAI